MGALWYTFVAFNEVICVWGFIWAFDFVRILNILADGRIIIIAIFPTPCITPMLVRAVNSCYINRFFCICNVVNFPLNCGFGIVASMGICWFYPCCGYKSPSFFNVAKRHG